jgi:hypothetical protein
MDTIKVNLKGESMTARSTELEHVRSEMDLLRRAVAEQFLSNNSFPTAIARLRRLGCPALADVVEQYSGQEQRPYHPPEIRSVP